MKHASSKSLMKSMVISVEMKYFSRHMCKKVCKGCSDVLCCSDVQMFGAAHLAGFVQDEDVVCCTNCFLCNGHNLPELRVFPSQPVLKIGFCALGTLTRAEGFLQLAFSLYSKLLFVLVTFHAWAHFFELSAQIAFNLYSDLIFVYVHNWWS